MTFSEKLKQAMQELHLNQRQVCGMTGKSKGSVSQYLSGKQVPSIEVQSSIATALVIKMIERRCCYGKKRQIN